MIARFMPSAFGFSTKRRPCSLQAKAKVEENKQRMAAIKLQARIAQFLHCPCDLGSHAWGKTLTRICIAGKVAGVQGAKAPGKGAGKAGGNKVAGASMHALFSSGMRAISTDIVDVVAFGT